MHQKFRHINHQYLSSYSEIIELINRIDPLAYDKTRNYGDGALTHLSPYLSRGVISCNLVYTVLKEKAYRGQEMATLLRELTRRENFQRLGQTKTEELLSDLFPNRISGIPAAVLQSSTGIRAIDKGIRDLYNKGYVHNKLRAGIASLVCNLGGCQWQEGASWMYYHLLDADFASNAFNWQWVAGLKSGRKFLLNQTSINRHMDTFQKGTFLDHSYEELESMETPEILKPLLLPELFTELPASESFGIDEKLPTLIYNFYNLDPLWRHQEKANRVLLLEPSHFKKFPISVNSLNFVLKLKENIKDIKVFTGEWNDLKSFCGSSTIIFKEHPLFRHYEGVMDEREWMVNLVD